MRDAGTKIFDLFPRSSGRSDYTVYSDNRLRHRRSGYNTNLVCFADDPVTDKVILE